MIRISSCPQDPDAENVVPPIKEKEEKVKRGRKRKPTIKVGVTA